MADKIQIPTGKDYALDGLLNVASPSEDEERTRTIAIMVHGFPGDKSANSNLFGDLDVLFEKRGVSSLRFDLHGCGDSDGDEQDFTINDAKEDLKLIHQWCKKQGFRNFVYVGEGLGASICIYKIELNTKAMILFWPVLDLQDYGEKITSYAGPVLQKELQTLDLMPEIKDLYMSLLVIHGAQDQMVPVDRLNFMRKHLNSKNAEITIFQDGGHGLPLDSHRQAMLPQIDQFIEKYA